MKTFLLFFLWLTVFSPAWARAAEEDFRSKVIGRGSTPSSSTRIDPDKDIYGVPFGTSEDDFIKAQGKPTGYVRLSNEETVLLYGTSHGFLFDDGKLSGVRITHNLLDWKLTQGMPVSGPFDVNSWRLNNGIRQEMSRAEIKRILGEKLSNETPYQFYYRTEKARVDLDFSHYTQQGDDDDSYRIHGILVRQGGREYSPFRTSSLPFRRADALPEPLPEGMGMVGIVLGAGDGEGLLDVIAVTKNSPAEKAGVRPGSLIVSVDGTLTEAKSAREVTRLLRGKPGTKVTLEFWNLAADKTNKVTLTRETPVTPSKPAPAPGE